MSIVIVVSVSQLTIATEAAELPDYADELDLVWETPDDAAPVRGFSVGTDTVGVGICDVEGYHGDVSRRQAMEHAHVAARYLAELSGGRYEIELHWAGRRQGPLNFLSCPGLPFDTGVPVEAMLIFVPGFVNDDVAGGQAEPGLDSATWPGNGRFATVGTYPDGRADPATVVHELGHTLNWPHSQASSDGSSGYDNPVDIMGDAMAADGMPFGTLAFNRYAAGWIPASDVVRYQGGRHTVALVPPGGDGVQLVAIPLDEAATRVIVVDTRTRSDDDPLPTKGEGVNVHLVDNRQGKGMFRRHTQYPEGPPGGFSHVLTVGETLAESSWFRLAVTDQSEEGYVVDLVGFADIADSVFAAAILDVTQGHLMEPCDPSADDLFCPHRPVTRGEAAGFLVRMWGLSERAGIFVDTEGSGFGPDIERLAAAGITLGCNPPTNDRFCPHRLLTRGELAAFLTRALSLSGWGRSFVDVGGSGFRSDIERLAMEGITLGCDPPHYDRFCPDAVVTRGQMAAFLSRVGR